MTICEDWVCFYNLIFEVCQMVNPYKTGVLVKGACERRRSFVLTDLPINNLK